MQCFKPLWKAFLNHKLWFLSTTTKPLKFHFWLIFSRKSEKNTKSHENACFSAFCSPFLLKFGIETSCIMFKWYLQVVFREHHLTSKNRHSRAIVFTMILIHPLDDVKSYKMTSYDIYDFAFGFYGRHYIRNVPTCFSTANLQELSLSAQCWSI